MSELSRTILAGTQQQMVGMKSLIAAKADKRARKQAAMKGAGEAFKGVADVLTKHRDLREAKKAEDEMKQLIDSANLGRATDGAKGEKIALGASRPRTLAGAKWLSGRLDELSKEERDEVYTDAARANTETVNWKLEQSQKTAEEAEAREKARRKTLEGLVVPENAFQDEVALYAAYKADDGSVDPTTFRTMARMYEKRRQVAAKYSFESERDEADRKLEASIAGMKFSMEQIKEVGRNIRNTAVIDARKDLLQMKTESDEALATMKAGIDALALRVKNGIAVDKSELAYMREMLKSHRWRVERTEKQLLFEVDKDMRPALQQMIDTDLTEYNTLLSRLETMDGPTFPEDSVPKFRRSAPVEEVQPGGGGAHESGEPDEVVQRLEAGGYRWTGEGWLK